MRDDNLEPNEIYLAFENYEDGLSAYFDSYDEAEDWALTGKMKTIRNFLEKNKI